MEKTFVRVRSVKDVIMVASLIVVGVILVVLPTGFGINIAGGALSVVGFVLVFVLKTGYEDADTGVRYFKKEHFFAKEMKRPLLSVLPSMPEVIELSEEDKGNGIRLDVFYNRQIGKAYLQLQEFIPYEYKPCSEMMEFNLYEVKRLIR